MAITIESDNNKDLREENLMLRTAINEAYFGIRWYVTTLALAILTNGGKLTVNNNLITSLEPMGEIDFDVNEIEGLEGMVEVTIKRKKDETIQENKGD